MREVGTVRNFDSKKGFGFLDNPDDTGDIFVHYKSILGEGYRDLDTGDTVTFLRVKTESGLAAKEVELVELEYTFLIATDSDQVEIPVRAAGFLSAIAKAVTLSGYNHAKIIAVERVR